MTFIWPTELKRCTGAQAVFKLAKRKQLIKELVYQNKCSSTSGFAGWWFLGRKWCRKYQRHLCSVTSVHLYIALLIQIVQGKLLGLCKK